MIRKFYKRSLFVGAKNPFSMCFALQPFDRMHTRDITTHMDLNNKAVQNFSHDRIPASDFGYAGALGVCAKNGDLRNGRVVHALVVVSGLARRAFLTNLLIEMYSKCRKIDEVRMVFDRAEELDDVLWNLLFSAYVRIGWPEVATSVLVWMHRNGVKLNCFALFSVLKACSDQNDCLELQRMLYACVIKVGLDLDLFVGSKMLEMYAENGGLDEAIKVLQCMSNPSVAVLNAMIAGFSRLGPPSCHEARLEALRLFHDMSRRGVRSSRYVFESVLEACSLAGAPELGKQIHAQVIANDLNDDDFIAGALVCLYSNFGLVEESQRCFNSMSKQEVRSWASMIWAYVQNAKFEHGLNLFNQMLHLGVEPNQLAMASAINACASLGVLRTGEQLQCYGMKAGLDRFTICCNSQINMYAKSGDIDGAIKTFQDTDITDIMSWSAMILSHGLHDGASDALMLFEEMKECKVTPDSTVFHAVLSACTHGGLIVEGFRYLESMKIEYGITPTTEHYVCIVDLLGRDGQLANAEDFMLYSGFNNDPEILKTLLRACQFHKDRERAVRVAERLLQLNPLAAATYMALYSIYWEAGNMPLAMRTRGLMRERGVDKEIGTCWIELGASVHSFVNGDSSHPEISSIYAKIEEMLLKMKQKGCASVKESLMKNNGEILAVALGMKHLPDSVPIRIMTNLTVSEDCHTILKLLSESERRDIVLRDSSRFHCFRCGLCSCKDYW